MNSTKTETVYCCLKNVYKLIRNTYIILIGKTCFTYNISTQLSKYYLVDMFIYYRPIFKYICE